MLFINNVKMIVHYVHYCSCVKHEILQKLPSHMSSLLRACTPRRRRRVITRETFRVQSAR